MSLFELGTVIFGPSEALVSWLRRKGLLSSSSNCARCAVPMVEGRRQDVSDGLVWRCRQCKGTKSIREGSFFSKSKLPLRKWVLLMHFWVRQYPVTDAGEECEVDKNSACNGGLLNQAAADFHRNRGTRICGSGGRVSFSPRTQGIFCMFLLIAQKECRPVTLMTSSN